MLKNNSLPFLFLMITLTCYAAKASSIYDVTEFGAKPDGITDSTKAFLNAWAKACGSPYPALIYVPRGRFLLGTATFSGTCTNKAISITIDGALVASSDYYVSGKAETWLRFQSVEGVSISGGVLDGQGTGLWNCKNLGRSNCPTGSMTLKFSGSKNIMISGLTSMNSQHFHIAFVGCQNVNAIGIKIMADGNSPNTDGIHVQMSSDITIVNSKIQTGDDCISIGPGTTNVWIENIACGPGHGISIGSLGWELNEPGVQNVTVKMVRFTETQNGVRIKSWGRPSNGIVSKVVYQDVIMVDVQNPIIIDQNYCPYNTGCPGQVSGIKINDITYQDIHGTSATEVAVKFDCSSMYPCSGIKLKDVRLTYNNQVAVASCKNAGGAALGSVQPESCL